MKEVENNALFWQKLDTLYVSSTMGIEFKQGSVHPVYQKLVYPVDYGIIEDVHNYGDIKMGVFKGSLDSHCVDAIAVNIDTLQRDSDIKLLVGCNEDETFRIMQFLNETDFQKSILVRRSEEVSSWASLD